ncbi:efflux RND transporter periplasmic adaptor subunit [Leptothrix discophora]|uniref:Efflux RND transporter periplasmic adaptor subunit n=1 Tax=Leptothrix discophora TaxID=89 RepID=A0ABT9FYD2_LEPDI|nr:efflux RND transporter periplasmic adaptor subunit [Leptothrix discophora]MDP4299245.1 efflux RND transporter periplasmic adaptor subunit [Leptothrix discophora]
MRARPVQSSPRFLPLLAALGGALWLAACSKPEPAPEPLRAVRTMVVGRDAAAGEALYAAEVRARTESRLGFRVAGKLTSRPVELGQAVRKGQLLAELDVADLGLGAEAAQAALRAAQVNAEQAASDFKRFEDLHAQGFISAADLERRQNAQRAAQATLEQARAQASVQGNQARYSKLLADVSGVVTAVEAEPGAVLGAGTPVVRVAQDGPRDIVFQVPEDQVGGLRSLLGKASALRVTLWGAQGQPLAATLREVAAAADPVGRTFLVKASLGLDAGEVRLGQTATVSLARPVRQDVRRLPLSAVAESGGRSVVWVLDAAAMSVQPVPVVTGAPDGNQVVVTEGLQPGQEIVTAGLHVLTPGQKVVRYVDPKRPGAPTAGGVMPVSQASSAAR